MTNLNVLCQERKMFHYMPWEIGITIIMHITIIDSNNNQCAYLGRLLSVGFGEIVWDQQLAEY